MMKDKTLWERGKLLVTNIFSFFHHVFENILAKGSSQSELYMYVKKLKLSNPAMSENTD